MATDFYGTTMIEDYRPLAPRGTRRHAKLSRTQLALSVFQSRRFWKDQKDRALNTVTWMILVFGIIWLFQA